MKWRHMESKQRREQERAAATQAAAASRSACSISVPTSITTCNSRQTQVSGVSPSVNTISRANVSNITNSEISKPASVPQLGKHLFDVSQQLLTALFSFNKAINIIIIIVVNVWQPLRILY